MDPRDDLDSLAGGVGCAACGELVPTDRVRILARRDDLVFVEIACPGCRSDSLGIVIGPDAGTDADVPPAADAGAAWGEFGPDDIDRFREALPIEAADVDAVRRLLVDGDLTALVGRHEPPDPGSSR